MHSQDLCSYDSVAGGGKLAHGLTDVHSVARFKWERFEGNAERTAGSLDVPAERVARRVLDVHERRAIVAVAVPELTHNACGDKVVGEGPPEEAILQH